MEVSDAGYPPSRSQHPGSNSLQQSQNKAGTYVITWEAIAGLVSPDPTLLLEYLQPLLRKGAPM